MKLLDLSLNAPQMQNPIDAKLMASFVSELNERLKYIADNLGKIKISTSASNANEIVEIGDGKGGILSEVEIKHNAVAGSRTISYKYQGTVYTITSA